jgi:translation elongation factor EF-Ts
VRALKKPDNVVKNIVAGKMNKFYSEVCLAEQMFAVPESPAEEVSVNKLIAAEAKRLNLAADDVVC